MDTEPSQQQKELAFQVMLLKDACRDGKKDLVLLLIEKFKTNKTLDKVLNDVFDNQLRPLDEACQRGHSEIVKILLNNGACLESGRPEEYSPLEYACLYKHFDVIRTIIKHLSALQIVHTCMPEFRHLVQQIVNQESKIHQEATFIQACAAGKIDLVNEMLLDRDPSSQNELVNCQEPDGTTPMHAAA